MSLKRLADDLGVGARVRFLGWRDDRSALLRAANVCLVPSRFEPFGNVVVNAWAHEVPVVAAASQGPDFLIEDGVSGRKVPIDDAPALAAAVRGLLADGSLVAKIVAGGRARVAEAFSEAAVVNRYREVLQSVIERD